MRNETYYHTVFLCPNVLGMAQFVLISNACTRNGASLMYYYYMVIYIAPFIYEYMYIKALRR